jgi:Flp pilus assembly pilin Flp
MLAAWKAFGQDDEGADLIEYALLASIIAIGATTVLADLIVGVDGMLQRLITRIGLITFPAP